MKYFNLQLFANSTTKKDETQTSASQGSSSTVGGSHSETQYGSTSKTHSETQGGSHSETNGRTWAAGKVNEQTQAGFDKYNGDNYQQSSVVQDTYNRLQNTLNSKPGDFQSTYKDQLNSLFNNIMNYGDFKYDFNTDPMAKLYADSYAQSGKRAMSDTMGQAAALTGGYGSSYAQSVGQQQYQNYMNNYYSEVLPQLREQARSDWNNRYSMLKDAYSTAADAYNREYGEYRDTVSDWQTDRGFEQGAYTDERNFDWSQYEANRDYFMREYWNEKNAEQRTSSTTDATNWSTTDSQTDTRGWETTDSSNWSNTETKDNTTTRNQSTSNTISASTAGSAAASAMSAYSVPTWGETVNHLGYAGETQTYNGKEYKMDDSLLWALRSSNRQGGNVAEDIWELYQAGEFGDPRSAEAVDTANAYAAKLGIKLNKRETDDMTEEEKKKIKAEQKKTNSFGW